MIQLNVEAPQGPAIEAKGISPTEISMRAQRLRNQLVGAYTSLRARGTLDVEFRGTDLTPHVAPSLVAGMKFEDAVAVLREAGFEIGSPPGRREEMNPNRPRDWRAIVCWLELAAPQGARARISVTLTPTSPEAYDRLSAFAARLFISAP